MSEFSGDHEEALRMNNPELFQAMLRALKKLHKHYDNALTIWDEKKPCDCELGKLIAKAEGRS